ncbi:MAG: nucleotidyltransferase substrate binding protein [Gammaproteobacteria bacterium]|nr:nucleotidyltransferase substrate binding protein [Gammaproteobacteria bacterium]
MAMLAARNRTSRTYNLATANAILESIRDAFHGLFRDLAIELEQREQRL